MNVNTLWVGRPPSLMVRKCVQSLKNTRLPITVYGYRVGQLQRIFPEFEVRDASAVIPENELFTYNTGSGKGSYAAFANLFRYKLLAEQGGWWVDTDVYCLRAFRFDAPYVLVSEPGKPGLLHNGIIKAPPGSPLMQRMVQLASAADTKTMRWGTTGSKLLTTVVNRDFPALKAYVVPAQVFCPVHWASVHKTRNAPQTIRLAPSTVAVHLFNEMWRRNGIDTNANYPLYSWLLGKEQTNG